MDSQDKKMVVFDFDGVIVNTLPFCFIFYKKYNPDLTWEKYQEFSNGNFVDNVKEAIENGSHTDPKDFFDNYQEKISEVEVVDVLLRTIISLSPKYHLAIVSSTPSKIIKNYLTKKNLDKYFLDVLGSDIHSDKTIKINSLLSKYKVLPEDTVFITDSLGDILEGNRCGVHSIGVTWGIHQKDNLSKGNPTLIIDDPRDLFVAIKNVLK
jgi:HAD superfamily hydrolase (TIGR01509 family)